MFTPKIPYLNISVAEPPLKASDTDQRMSLLRLRSYLEYNISSMPFSDLVIYRAKQRALGCCIMGTPDSTSGGTPELTLYLCSDVLE